MRRSHMWWLVLLAPVIVLGACTRRATLMQGDSDSTATVAAGPDSSQQLLRDAEHAWEGQADDAKAASLTLRALQQDLRVHGLADWRGRAESVLDSLGVGVETAGATCAMIVNVFVRADPTRGSWPALFWCDGPAVRVQEIEGRGMRLTTMVSQAADSLVTGGVERAAAVFYRTRNGRQEPVLNAWIHRPRQARWALVQTLGPDSLGGSGTAEFQTAIDTVDLVARTFQPTRGFDECATCPHVIVEHRFRWRPDGFVRLDDHDVPSAYVTFVRLIGSLVDSTAQAEQLVTTPALLQQARDLGWNHAKGAWRIAPGTSGPSYVLTFFRGAQDAYRVTFEPRGEAWVVNAIQTAPRSLE